MVLARAGHDARLKAIHPYPDKIAESLEGDVTIAVKPFRVGQ
jgi:hypothetical protein